MPFDYTRLGRRFRRYQIWCMVVVTGEECFPGSTGLGPNREPVTGELRVEFLFESICIVEYS